MNFLEHGKVRVLLCGKIHSTRTLLKLMVNNNGAMQTTCVNTTSVLRKSLIITALLFSIVIAILVLYEHFNDQPTCYTVEPITHFGENEADVRDVIYNCVTLPLQTPDGEKPMNSVRC
jgi:hypothetical protein